MQHQLPAGYADRVRGHHRFVQRISPITIHATNVRRREWEDTTLRRDGSRECQDDQDDIRCSLHVLDDLVEHQVLATLSVSETLSRTAQELCGCMVGHCGDLHRSESCTLEIEHAT